MVSEWLKSAWDVLLLFLIPGGGGIPAGVLRAKGHGLAWPTMVGLYILSDVLLAFAFEPLLLVLRRVFTGSRFLGRVTEAYRASMRRQIARIGPTPSPFKLVMVAFGIDPMTGRAAALAAGHGFVTGWAIAIAGDLIFFLLLMASTLWLNDVLGDGTWAAVVIMALMFGVPWAWRRVRDARRPAASSTTTVDRADP